MMHLREKARQPVGTLSFTVPYSGYNSTAALTSACGANEDFHGGSIVRWSTREWDFFLEDLAKHHLHPTRSTVILNFINGFCHVTPDLTPHIPHICR